MTYQPEKHRSQIEMTAMLDYDPPAYTICGAVKKPERHICWQEKGHAGDHNCYRSGCKYTWPQEPEKSNAK